MGIDIVIWTIRDKIYDKLRNNWATERAMEPLIWYIGTGRAPLEFEQRLKACEPRQLTVIANRLIKHNGGNYDLAINSICQYIGFKRNCY